MVFHRALPLIRCGAGSGSVILLVNLTSLVRGVSLCACMAIAHNLKLAFLCQDCVLNFYGAGHNKINITSSLYQYFSRAPQLRSYNYFVGL